MCCLNNTPDEPAMIISTGCIILQKRNFVHFVAKAPFLALWRKCPYGTS
jgi:hypothetical protein